MTNLRILVVALDPLARAGIGSIIEDLNGFEVCGQLDLEESSLELLDAFRPDIVLLDLGWDAESVLQHLPLITGFEIPVVLMAPEDHSMTRWMEGIKGLVRRDAQPEELTAALTAVANDLVVMDPTLTSPEVDGWGGSSEILIDPLTDREMDVLKLLAEGKTNKAIAFALAISENTVKFHVNAILAKLGAQSRTEAAVLATRLGLLPL